MKYICRQVNPAYQESPMYRDRGIWNEIYDRLFLIPTDHCYGIRNDVSKDFFNNMEDATDAWYAVKERSPHGNYDTITEILNDLLCREDGEKWDTRQAHAWEEILDSWDEDEESVVLKALDLYYGGDWDSKQIRGCSQGDWALVYFDSSVWSKESIEALEIEYFNLGEEWCCSCDPMTDEEAEESEAEDADRSDCVYTYVYGWKEENKRKELAEVIGCDEDEVVMFKYCGVVNHSVYSRV